MTSPSRRRAWFDALKRTEPVHRRAATREVTPRQLALQTALDRLAQQPLPVEAIYQIAEAVLIAWAVGKEARGDERSGCSDATLIDEGSID